jgi:hypothetical protein
MPRKKFKLGGGNIKDDHAYDVFPKSGLVKQYEPFIRKTVSKFCSDAPGENANPGPRWSHHNHRGSFNNAFARDAFDICRGLPETDPATGSNCKSPDYRRSRSGGILLSCGIGSPSTRRLSRCLLLRTKGHHQKLD